MSQERELYTREDEQAILKQWYKKRWAECPRCLEDVRLDIKEREPDSFYGESVRVKCPRCGRNQIITLVPALQPSDVPDSPRALSSWGSERVTFHTTSDLKRRLEALAAQRGWTLSEAAHLALTVGVQALEAEARVTRVSVQDAIGRQGEG